MSEKYYTIFTQIGKATVANAIATQTKVNFDKIVLGDSAGEHYEPTQMQTELKNKVWEGKVSSITIDKENPNWVVVEAAIPGNVGGFMIREAGILDDKGQLLVVSKCPISYKPKAEDGTIKDILLKLIVEVTNTECISLKVDPTVILATKKDLDKKADKNHKHHKADISDFQHTHLKADILDFAHTHFKKDISDFQHTHLKADITDFAHTHPISDIIGLKDLLSALKKDIDALQSTTPPPPPTPPPKKEVKVFWLRITVYESTDINIGDIKSVTNEYYVFDASSTFRFKDIDIGLGYDGDYVSVNKSLVFNRHQIITQKGGVMISKQELDAKYGYKTPNGGGAYPNVTIDDTRYLFNTGTSTYVEK